MSITLKEQGDMGSSRLQDPAAEDTVLPINFLAWQRQARISLCTRLMTDGPSSVKTMPAHLAVMSSVSEDGTVNLATKGMGLLPKPDRLEESTGLLRSAIDKCQGSAWETTLHQRATTLLNFYDDLDRFDNTKLGGLEIFEGSTYRNLTRNPKATLLFTGEAPIFLSYQIEGRVEFVPIGDGYHAFLSAARELFAHDRFHVFQTSYPLAYLFHVSKVRDKTPFTRG